MAKIEEVTGINDQGRIVEAISQCSNEAGDYELDEVISVLLAETPATRSPPVRTQSAPNPQTAPSTQIHLQSTKAVSV